MEPSEGTQEGSARREAVYASMRDMVEAKKATGVPEAFHIAGRGALEVTLQEEEARYQARKAQRRGKRGAAPEPLYNVLDALNSMLNPDAAVPIKAAPAETPSRIKPKMPVIKGGDPHIWN